MTIHRPVMLPEVLEGLRPALRPSGLHLELTTGAGGHLAAILEAAPEDLQVIAFDRDKLILEHATERLAAYSDRISFVARPFAEVGKLLAERDLSPSSALLDLGVSSLQLDDADRGFSFREEGPLDMRMTSGKGKSARDLLAESSPEELARIFHEYGEEPSARRIAERLVDLRKRRVPRTTTELANFIVSLHPRRPGGRSRSHSATRIFQALRIAVNDELGQLERTLDVLIGRLAPDGVVAVIAFHSLEDRIVKTRFRDAAKAGRIELVTPKPLGPSPDELADNPRARSARLRLARGLGEGSHA